MQSYPVLLTKINPPQLSARALERPRVTEALMEALHYRLTLVHAGAGYGKSTAVMSLIDKHQPLIWYQISREDADPFVFLQHLLALLRGFLREAELQVAPGYLASGARVFECKQPEPAADPELPPEGQQGDQPE